MNKEIKQIAHDGFIKGYLKGYGWPRWPKNWVLKEAEKEWKKIEYRFE
ncbi:MAG: hypothetical protein ABSB71_08080 [Candidatus Bathyarchaeia archaeon]|jgi:hypothetical protein